jgi:hypothetical protein
MQNNTMTTINNQKSIATYSGISDINTPDDAFYRHVRSRFLQQSAQYFGADLSNSKALSLCSKDLTQKDLFRN